MSYKYWREAVIRILIGQLIIRESTKVSEDIYLPYFEDGYTPARAVKDDLGADAIRYLGEVTTLK